MTFSKNEEFKALVQMETMEQAQAAQSALDGRDIYTGCNTLNIVFSKHTELRVRFNDERSRDYTNPNLPTGPSAGESRGNGEPYYDEDPRGAPPIGHRDTSPPPSYGRAPMHPERLPPMRDDYVDNRDARGSRYGRGTMDRYGPGPDSRDRDRDRDQDRRPLSPRYNESGPPLNNRNTREREAPPGGVPVRDTGRMMRTDIPPSAVLICSNMDRTLVVMPARSLSCLNAAALSGSLHTPLTVLPLLLCALRKEPRAAFHLFWLLWRCPSRQNHVSQARHCADSVCERRARKSALSLGLSTA